MRNLYCIDWVGERTDARDGFRAYIKRAKLAGVEMEEVVYPFAERYGLEVTKQDCIVIDDEELLVLLRLAISSNFILVKVLDV